MRLTDYLIVLAADRGMSLPVFADAIGAGKEKVGNAISKRGSADGYMVDYLDKAMDVLKCTQRERDELTAIAAGKTYQKHLQGKRLWTKPSEVEQPKKPMNVYGAKRYENVLAMVKAGKTDAEIMEEWPEMTVDVLVVYHKVAEGKLTKMSARDAYDRSNGQRGLARVGDDGLDGFENLYAKILRGEEEEAYAGESMQAADMRISAEEAAKWRTKKPSQRKEPVLTKEERKQRERERQAANWAAHHDEILARQRARYAEKHAERIKAREEYRMSDKEYKVTWDEKDGLKKVQRSMTIKARTAVAAVEKFKAAFAGARTGKQAHNIYAKIVSKEEA